MKIVRAGYRSFFLVLLIMFGALLTLLLHRSNNPTAGLSGKITCWFHRQAIRILGIKVTVYGKPSEDTALFVSNHLSWLDILIIGSVLQVRFLSKAEVKKLPVIGWLATRAGTLYVQRGGRTSAQQALDAMTDALMEDHHVVLFPEGTTTDGNVRRFNGRLIQSAIDANVVIHPVAVRYPCPQGGATHPATLFDDNVTLMQTVKRIIAASDIKAELYFLEPIATKNKTRTELAQEAEQQVRRLVEKNNIPQMSVDQSE